MELVNVNLLLATIFFFIIQGVETSATVIYLISYVQFLLNWYLIVHNVKI